MGLRDKRKKLQQEKKEDETTSVKSFEETHKDADLLPPGLRSELHPTSFIGTNQQRQIPVTHPSMMDLSTLKKELMNELSKIKTEIIPVKKSLSFDEVIKDLEKNYADNISVQRVMKMIKLNQGKHATANNSRFLTFATAFFNSLQDAGYL